LDGAKEVTEKHRKDPLEGVDQSKRRTLSRLALGAFVAPIVASFPMDGLTISKVHAQVANGSGIVNPPNQTQP
jgi:hypothetical protein